MATCCEQLDKLGFEVIPIPYDNVVPFGGILHFSLGPAFHTVSLHLFTSLLV